MLRYTTKKFCQPSSELDLENETNKKYDENTFKSKQIFDYTDEFNISNHQTSVNYVEIKKLIIFYIDLKTCG